MIDVCTYRIRLITAAEMVQSVLLAISEDWRFIDDRTDCW